MRSFFKFRGKLVPVEVCADGGLEFCLLYSDKKKQFQFIDSRFRERLWRAKNKHIDLEEEMPEWEINVFGFPFKTLPRFFKLRAVRREIESEYKDFQMI